MSKSIILNNKQLEVSLDRLACQLLENHNDFTNTVLVGLQSSGIKLCNKILYILKNKYKIYDIDFGYLDITFFREEIKIYFYQIKLTLNYLLKIRKWFLLMMFYTLEELLGQL